MKVSLITGGGDKPYALGLLNALTSRKVAVDFIASDDLCTPEVLADENAAVYNLRGSMNPEVPVVRKMVRLGRYYLRLFRYASTTDSGIFHVLWANKVLLLDRVFLNLYYKLLGKKIVFTAHNVNERERDGGDSLLNLFSLKALYALADHIFVHTMQMRSQLIREFSVAENKISVIPFGINNTLPRSELTGSEARNRLGLAKTDKVILFFGNLASYKGLEYAIRALGRLIEQDDSFRLVVAGQVKDDPGYWENLERLIQDLGLQKVILKRIDYVPDEDVEVFFKSAHVLVLPYRFIYQSGVLFLAYSFGLPVIASDVGSLREDIVEGRTGFVCRPQDAGDLADKIRKYFSSELFANLDYARGDIMAYGNRKYSWDEVGNITCDVYARLLNEAGWKRPGQGL